MNFMSVVVSTAILIATSAQADSTKMASLAGRYLVKSCKYTQNYKKRPQDYYCRAKEFTLIDNKAGGVEIRFVDEINQDRPDIIMTEYRKDQKDGSLEQATFNYDESALANWFWKNQGNNQSATEQRTFNLAEGGAIRYTRDFSFDNGSVYKIAQWDIELVKAQ